MLKKWSFFQWKKPFLCVFDNFEKKLRTIQFFLFRAKFPQIKRRENTGEKIIDARQIISIYQRRGRFVYRASK